MAAIGKTKTYEEARDNLYRALSGNCSPTYREAVITDFEKAVVERESAGRAERAL